jgi:hypothetical protein
MIGYLHTWLLQPAFGNPSHVAPITSLLVSNLLAKVCSPVVKFVVAWAAVWPAVNQIDVDQCTYHSSFDVTSNITNTHRSSKDLNW